MKLGVIPMPKLEKCIEGCVHMFMCVCQRIDCMCMQKDYVCVHAGGLHMCVLLYVCIQEDYMCVHAHVHAEGCVYVCSVCMHLPTHVD